MWWAPGFCNVNDRLGVDHFMESCEPADGVCTDAGNRGLAMWDNGYVDVVATSDMVPLPNPAPHTQSPKTQPSNP